jgi:long-chain acyl-CoA synthetase
MEYNTVRTVANTKELIGGSAWDFGNRIAFRFKQGRDVIAERSYVGLKEQVDGLGTALYYAEDKPANPHIAILSENRYEWILSYLAILGGAGVAVPVDRDLPAESIEFVLKKGDVTAVIYSAAYEDILKNMDLPGVRLIGMDTGELEGLIYHGLKLIGEDKLGYLELKLDVNKTAAILFTSGTTSFSKGVMLSQKNLISNLLGATAINNYGKHDTMFSILPYHHSFESTIGILASLNNGATICINDSLKYFAKNLQTFKPNAFFAVPAVVYGMLKRIKDAEVMLGRMPTAEEVRGAFGGNLKRIHCGSAPLKPEAIETFNSLGIELFQGYGLTETSPVVSSMRGEFMKGEGISSVGVRIPCCRVKILDGEIIVKGDNVFSGYYKDEERTKEAFTKDGWFKTGDLGRIDDDGLIYILGRKKNIIIAPGGENVYPEEIEEGFVGSDTVLNVMVYGGENGDVITAVMYPDYENLGDKGEGEIRELILAEVRGLNKRFPLYKHITEIKIRKNPFEITTSRKIKRNKNNEMEGEVIRV